MEKEITNDETNTLIYLLKYPEYLDPLTDAKIEDVNNFVNKIESSNVLTMSLNDFYFIDELFDKISSEDKKKNIMIIHPKYKMGTEIENALKIFNNVTRNEKFDVFYMCKGLFYESKSFPCHFCALYTSSFFAKYQGFNRIDNKYIIADDQILSVLSLDDNIFEESIKDIYRTHFDNEKKILYKDIMNIPVKNITKETELTQIKKPEIIYSHTSKINLIKLLLYAILFIGVFCILLFKYRNVPISNLIRNFTQLMCFYSLIYYCNMPI